MYRNKFVVLDSRNSEEQEIWDRIVNTLFDSEPMMTHTYCKLFCNSDETPYLAIYSKDDATICYPFILRSIPFCKGYYDTTTPYGYGGPQISGKASHNFADEFWRHLNSWVESKNVVSEFIRFSLFTDYESICFPGEKEYKLKNIVRNINTSIEDIWMDFDHKVRKNVKKAYRNSLTVEIDETGNHIEDFLKIYYGTMDRRNANDTYYFNRHFFETIIKELSGSYAFFNVMLDGKIISSELVLHSKKHIYSYLGGTDESYFKLRPNDLLKYEIIRWGIETGKKAFILGGGYCDEDGIFNYKKSFAPNGEMDFYIGKRVIQPEVYHKLSGIDIENVDFFPAYRQKL